MSQIPPPPPLDEFVPPEPHEPHDEARPALKWNAWDILMVFLTGVAFGVLAIVVVLISFEAIQLDLSGPVQVGIASVVIYAAVLLSGWLFVLKRRGATAADVGFKWVGAGPLLIAIPIVLGLMAVTALILFGIEELFGGVPTAQDQVAPDESSLQVIDLVWLLLAGSVAAPIVEEFFFRGLLYRYLRVRSGFWIGALVSALLFAVFHITPALMPALFVFGIVQAWLYERYDSLYPPILLHALNNGVLLVAVYASLS
ncbi:MAG: lysostaphin resistance A-like protein [Actinomycetota bacterium]